MPTLLASTTKPQLGGEAQNFLTLTPFLIMACFTALDYRNKSYPFVQTISDAAGISSISYGCYDASSDSAKLYQFYNPLYVIGTTLVATSLVVGVEYQIISLGDTNWDTVAGTTGVTYVAGDVITVVAVEETGTGTASLIPVSQNCFVQKTEDQQYYLTNEALALALA
jgi:hypothetical protein